MKKLSAIIIAMALVLGMSQCKKQETPTGTSTEDGMVYITVNVENGGGRHHIEPSVGAYIFTNGDVLYVGDGDHYIGSLSYSNGAFTGGIEAPLLGSYLHFYFLGGKGPNPNDINGNPQNFTIDIADQSNNLPLLAYGCSAQPYTGPNGPYSTTLRNKCALVKFELLAGTTKAVTVANMLTEAAINFNLEETENAIVPKTTEGTITLYSESETEKWAILLPQEETISEFTVYIGSKLYPVSGSCTISNNGFINSGIVVENFNYVDLGELAGNYEAQDGDLLMGTLTSACQISIASGATVVLRDANINYDESMTGNYAGITCPFDATIILQGSNYVRAFAANYPGIFIAPDNTLTIQGDGSLYAECINYGAGIGGGKSIACGNIVIKGGNINAKSYGGNAAIGAGNNESGNGADCGYISIEGGTINATAFSNYGAGIGSGLNSNCGDITISGGTVTAKSQAMGAGIGQGYVGTCGTITIGAGITKVTATRGEWFGGSPQCIGSYTGENTVTVSVASVLTDSGEGSTTRTIEHFYN